MPVAVTSDTRKISIRPIHTPGDTLYFSTIITEFSDTWTPRWSEENVYGRLDPISSFHGVSREIALGFRIISDDREEAKQNMAKLQQLITYQYPEYIYGYGDFEQPPIISAYPYFEFKFMNIIGGMDKLQGYINGPIQINPGFQSKEQSQYFSSDSSKIYFSDVNIILKIQVMHKDFVGNLPNFSQPNYPYGVTDMAAQFAAAQANIPESSISLTKKGTKQQEFARKTGTAVVKPILKSGADISMDKYKSLPNIDI